MADSGHSHDHDYPLISQVKGELLRSYASMMARLNGDIAKELKRARGLSKGGPILTLIQGGKSDAAANRLVTDLSKGDRAPADVQKATHVAQSSPATDKKYANQAGYQKRLGSDGRYHWYSTKVEEKKERPRAQAEEPKKRTIQGAWYADEEGNVRYGPSASGRFKRKLDDEEVKKLHTSLTALVGEMHGQVIADFCKVSESMGHDIDEGIFDTLKQSIGEAAITGQTPQEVFVENYVAGEMEEYEDQEDEELIAEFTETANELYSNMVETFQEVASDPAWKKWVNEALQKQKKNAIETANRIKREKRIIKDSFNDLLTAPADGEAVKALSLLHDMGLFFMPTNVKQARPYAESKAEAEKLVDTVILDSDRQNMLLKYADTMSVEQQMMMSVMQIIVDAEEAKQDGGVDAEKEFWDELQGEHGSLDFFRESQEEQGRTFTDEEFAKVSQRTIELAQLVKQHLDAQNDDQGGFVYKALHHGKTDYKKLFKDPDEVERLKNLQNEENEKIERALAAQESTDHEIDPVVIEGLRRSLDNPKADLFSFQKQAVAWMEAIESGLLAYDAGLGKTPISIAYISNMIKKGKIKRGVMVLPANLMAQWPKEVEKFRPGSKVQVISSDYSLEDRLAQIEAINKGELEADFVFISAGTISASEETDNRLQELAAQYEAAIGKPFPRTGKDDEEGEGKIKIPKHIRREFLESENMLKEDKMVQALRGIDGAWIFDEAHSGGQGLKDPMNMHHMIAKEILDDKKYKFGMTATPMPEGPKDLFALSNLFHPGSAGESAGKFERRIINFEETYDPETGKKVKVPVDADMEDLREAKRRIKPYVFMQRKSNEDILKEMESKGMKLPKVNPVSHAMKLDPQAQDVYTRAGELGFDEDVEPPGGYKEGYLTDKQMYEKMLKKGEMVANMVMKMRYYIRRQRAAISPKLLDKNYTGPQPKIDQASDIIQRHFADPQNKDKPVVIFSSWLDSLDLMKEELAKKGIPKHLMGTISGEVDQSERDAVQDAVNEGKLKIVLIGIKAGGAGLNLQKAAYRNIFLDKPWTPADMEQAVGRTWRTGSPADTVHVHHMKVADTIDEKKFEKLSGRVSLVDALTFADADTDYLSGQVFESIRRLVGSFDEDVDKWTPEQEEAVLQLAGLPKGEIPPFSDMAAMREDFNLADFKETQDFKAYKKNGDQKIKEMSVMNDVRLKAGLISPAQHARKRKEIAKDAEKWMGLVDAAGDHPVAVYTKDNFIYGTPGTSTVMGGNKGEGKGKAPPKTTKPKFASGLATSQALKVFVREAKRMGHPSHHTGKLDEKGEAKLLEHFAKFKPADRKTLATWLRSKQAADAAPLGQRRYLAGLVEKAKSARKPKAGGAPKLPIPTGKTPLKMTEKSSFSLKNVNKNTFKEGTEDWAVWEALRRKRPKSYKEAVKHMAEWIYEYHADMEDPDERYSKAEARDAAKETITPKTLQKFVKRGLIQVTA